MCLKRLITVPFESSEPLYLLRLMGMSVPSDSVILHFLKCKNISIQMLKDIGMVVPKIIETRYISTYACAGRQQK